jgi:hypothetical protein
MNHCDTGGWVVGPRPLSDDPADYDVEWLPKLGCNRIRCRRCGCMVRSIAGWRSRDTGPADVRAFAAEIPMLYETADLTTSPRLEPGKNVRFYLCKCDYHEERDKHPLREKDTEWAISVVAKWECDGHPLMDLPRAIDGIVVTADNLGQLVRDALHGWLPPNVRETDKPRARWLGRLHARLAGTPFADIVAAAVSASSTDPDPAVRERAQQFPSANTPR